MNHYLETVTNTLIDIVDGHEFEIPNAYRKLSDEEFSQLHVASLPQKPIVSISPRQIRQALTRAGLRAAVEAAVAAGDQDLKDWYEFSTAFERLNPQVTAMGVALGVSASALDDLWTLGASL